MIGIPPENAGAGFMQCNDRHRMTGPGYLPNDGQASSKGSWISIRSSSGGVLSGSLR